jgi:hypothetical protein
MEKRQGLGKLPKKKYQKPAWEKEEMLARFQRGCCKIPAQGGCGGGGVPGQNHAAHYS